MTCLELPLYTVHSFQRLYSFRQVIHDLLLERMCLDPSGSQKPHFTSTTYPKVRRALLADFNHSDNLLTALLWN